MDALCIYAQNYHINYRAEALHILQRQHLRVCYHSHLSSPGNGPRDSEAMGGSNGMSFECLADLIVPTQTTASTLHVSDA
jgi:hypothetical protein